MNADVEHAIEQLRCAYPGGEVLAVDDGAGGARVIVEMVAIGPRFAPETTWMGGHLTGQYPYADIYPVFIDDAVQRADGTPFVVPVTHGHVFLDRPALQVSRINRQVGCAPQTAAMKFAKIVAFLQDLP